MMTILGCQMETFLPIDLNTDRQQAGKRRCQNDKPFGMMNFFEDAGNKRRAFGERVVCSSSSCLLQSVDAW